MTVVVQASNVLTIPEEIAEANGVHPGSRVEILSTPEGIMIRPLADSIEQIGPAAPIHRSKLTPDERVALAKSLAGAGRSLVAFPDTVMETLYQMRAEELAFEEESV